ncbi:hypothetical protein PUN71_022165 [Arthrobacter sp. NQ7]|uniref:hypothetical protein n=1 Tax=Arthrobacter sp. NQ7 TaxID=3032303 RepID=UPI00240EF7B9|nr:hypothetical protein [Arthrobacter sp. NQ7]MDJ0459916.1 hypothetical protein [Arthrobacter sp. NQ7]
MSGQQNERPTEEELKFLAEMGMTEVEPGRWVSGWQGSDPGMQDWFDNLGSEGEEQLDLLMRAGRVQNEFDMEQTGDTSAANVQMISSGPLATTPPPVENEGQHGAVLTAFVAVRHDAQEAFDALDGKAIEDAFDQMYEKYETMQPQDALAAALRSLGIKCKTINLDAMTAGPEGPDPRDYPGFRGALVHIEGGIRRWIDPA